MDFNDCTLMVIDDEKFYRTSIVAVIKYHINCNILEFEDGQTALDYLKTNEHPDLILLDLKMPFMNGLELLKEIRKDPVLKSLPVIPFTQYTDSEVVKQLLKLNIYDYIVKGLDMQRIVDKITKALIKIKYGENID